MHPKYLIRHVLQDFNIDDFKAKPPSCYCNNSPFKYSPTGHVNTGDLNIREDEHFCKNLAKGPQYREPQSIHWKYNFKLLMYSVYDYSRKWTKRQKE